MSFINQLTELVGKPCSVFTSPINRNFKEENPQSYPKQVYCYFVGILQSIDENGVVLQQLTTGLKTYIFSSSIVAIAEEEMLDPDNAKDAEIISSIKSQQQSEYVDIDTMNEILTKMKNKQINQ